MKILALTLLYMTKFEHSPIKIQSNARIGEETSALFVSAKMNTQSINHQKKLSKKYESDYTC